MFPCLRRYEQLLQPIWDEAERLVREAVFPLRELPPPGRVVVAGGLARLPRMASAVARALEAARAERTGAAPAATAPALTPAADPETLAAVGAAVLGVLEAQRS